mmetsp:Transcript_32499/g.85337  ORF Transcript_32499/g.85337 Transcript_32499/m.85337 type:complete len:134 (+) Transcript_32499:144-545(+)
MGAGWGAGQALHTGRPCTLNAMMRPLSAMQSDLCLRTSTHVLVHSSCSIAHTVATDGCSVFSAWSVATSTSMSDSIASAGSMPPSVHHAFQSVHHSLQPALLIHPRAHTPSACQRTGHHLASVASLMAWERAV